MICVQCDVNIGFDMVVVEILYRMRYLCSVRSVYGEIGVL